MAQSFQSERISPLAAHIVVGDGLFAGGAGKDIRTGLDRPWIVARRQGSAPESPSGRTARIGRASIGRADRFAARQQRRHSTSCAGLF
jgi:hypothetical protein